MESQYRLFYIVILLILFINLSLIQSPKLALPKEILVKISERINTIKGVVVSYKDHLYSFSPKDNIILTRSILINTLGKNQVVDITTLLILTKIKFLSNHPRSYG